MLIDFFEFPCLLSGLANLYDNEELAKYVLKIDPKMFKCAACGMASPFSSNIRAHVESQHYSPGYTCEFCSKMFKIRKSYNIHMKKCPAQVWNRY